MALTMECAQCHDHKYDPISQQEYYQFFAYFNNTTDPGMQTRKGNQTPVVNVVDELRESASWRNFAEKIETKKRSWKQYKRSVETEFNTWATEKTDEFRGHRPTAKNWPGSRTGSRWTRRMENSLDQRNHRCDRHARERETCNSAIADGNQTLKLNGKTAVSRARKPHRELKNDQPFTLGRLDQIRRQIRWCRFLANGCGQQLSRITTCGSRGERRNAHHASWPDNAVKVVSKDPLKTDTWQHVVITLRRQAKRPRESRSISTGNCPRTWSKPTRLTAPS